MGAIYDEILGKLRTDGDGGGGGGVTPDDLVFTEIVTSTAASLDVNPGKAIVWTPSGDGILSSSGGRAGTRAYACVDIVLGASNTVTLSGMSWASQDDTLESNATNRCVVIFDGTSAVLAVC